VNLERCRKDAKALARGFRAAYPEAIERAQAVLGRRAHERFQLSDAQHVVAVEHGYRTWPELKHAAAELDKGLARTEETVDAGLEYLPGDPVVLRAVRRRLLWIDDQGGAVARAGMPAGWREVAERIADELIVNISRNGTVSLPVSRGGPGYDAIIRRIAEASVVLHEELLELE